MIGSDLTAAPLSISLFGPFEVRVNGDPLPRLRSRKGYWLLALLVLRSPASGYPREVERSWLAGTLWPDDLEPQAFASLRNSLKDLRQALGPESHRLRSPTPRTLSLDLKGAAVDLLAFDTAIARQDPASLEHAVCLYRGPLLEGWVEEWVLPERQAREEAYLGALERLAAQARAREDPAAAGRYLRLAVAADPLRETAQRALMEALAASGEYAAATQTYRELRLLLHRELNAEPAPETSALFQQIRAEARCRAQAPTRAFPRAASSPAPLRFAVPRPPLLPHNLPRQVTSFVGREPEMAEVRQRLATTALLTLTGAGGCGKTRLALQVAAAIAAGSSEAQEGRGDLSQEYRDGVWLVELAPLGEPALVPNAVATALGVREQPGRPLMETLVDFLRPKSLLLVLDNCEHLIAGTRELGGCAQLAQALLRGCPGLRILATSREPLRITAETVWPVPPLAVPDPKRLPPDGAERVAVVMQHAAVRLFAERAAATSAFTLTPENAAATVQVCRRLDGIPLAIELAAARTRLLSPEAMLARLVGAPFMGGRPQGSPLQLLTGGARDLPARQQTLRGAIAWSYDLLEEDEKRLFRWLSVFAGGCTLEAAEAVCEAVGGHHPLRGYPIDVLDGMASLLDKSLLRERERADGEPRLGMLETIREYGLECLDASGEAVAVRHAHAQHYLELAELAESELRGPRQVAWLERLEREHDNLRAALRWAEESDEAEIGLRLAGALGMFWDRHGHLNEGRGWCEGAVARAGALGRTQARARALVHAGVLAWRQGDLGAARSLVADGLAISRELMDLHGAAFALGMLGVIARFQGNLAESRALLEESVALGRETGEHWNLAFALVFLGFLQEGAGNYAAARSLYDESSMLFRQVGERFFLGAPLSRLGILAQRRGDYAAARALIEESIAIEREVGEKWTLGRSIRSLGIVAQKQEDYATARSLLEDSLTMVRELGSKTGIAEAIDALAGLAVVQGEAVRAARLFGAAAALRDTIGARPDPGDRAEYEPHLQAARAASGEQAFAAAWAEGRTMTLEQALAAAFQEAEKRSA